MFTDSKFHVLPTVCKALPNISTSLIFSSNLFKLVGNPGWGVKAMTNAQQW